MGCGWGFFLVGGLGLFFVVVVGGVLFVCFFPSAGTELLHFKNGLNDCLGPQTAVIILTNPWQKPHSWKSGIKGQKICQG